MQAHAAGTAGEIDRVLDLLDQLHKIPENELSTDIISFAATLEMFTRHDAGQWDLCEAAARNATRVVGQSRYVWSRPNIEMRTFLAPASLGPASGSGEIDTGNGPARRTVSTRRGKVSHKLDPGGSGGEDRRRVGLQSRRFSR